MALRYFRRAAAIDLADTHVAIDGGVHIAALGGIWLTAVFGFAGLSLRRDGIALDPQLPPNWRSLGFGVQWRGRRLKIKIVPGQHSSRRRWKRGNQCGLSSTASRTTSDVSERFGFRPEGPIELKTGYRSRIEPSCRDARIDAGPAPATNSDHRLVSMAVRIRVNMAMGKKLARNLPLTDHSGEAGRRGPCQRPWPPKAVAKGQRLQGVCRPGTTGSQGTVPAFPGGGMAGVVAIPVTKTRRLCADFHRR